MQMITNCNRALIIGFLCGGYKEKEFAKKRILIIDKEIVRLKFINYLLIIEIYFPD